MKVLLGFRNHGESMLNVSHIAGSLNVVGQFSQYVQNLTLLASLPRRPRPNRASRRPSPPPDPWPPRSRARGHHPRGAQATPDSLLAPTPERRPMASWSPPMRR